MTATTPPVTTTHGHPITGDNIAEQHNPFETTEGVNEPASPTHHTVPLATAPPEHSEPHHDVPSMGHDTTPVHETPSDPKIAALLGMFPDFDISLLQSVLDSVSGDQDKAIDALLGMSDPNFRSTGHPDATQTELDEEMARRLMLEESEQQAAWQPRGQGVPYQPRTHLAPQPPPAQPGSQPRQAEGDSMAQFQEQLGKFAETGKKTFNTLFSKVKAKMQEFDGSPGQGQSSGSAQPLPHGDSWSTPAQSQAYYAPEPSRVYEGYEMGGAAPPHTSSHALVSTAPQSTSVAPPSTAGAPPPEPTNTAAPTAGNVDPSKIGLLPKRPVSLGSSPQPSKNFDDDDVEYVENPFEESARH